MKSLSISAWLLIRAALLIPATGLLVRKEGPPRLRPPQGPDNRERGDVPGSSL